jgi:hypothetical protein
MNPGRVEVLGEHAANPPQAAAGAGGSTIRSGWCPSCKRIKHVRRIGLSCDCGSAVIAREWPCSALEDRIIAQFEAEVRRRARQAYLDIAETDPRESAAMRAQYMDDFSAEAYNWEDQGANLVNHVKTARTKTWGAIYLVFLLLRRCDESVTVQTAVDLWKANPDDAVSVFLWAQGLVRPPSAETLAKNAAAPEAQPTGAQTPPPSQPTFG